MCTAYKPEYVKLYSMNVDHSIDGIHRLALFHYVALLVIISLKCLTFIYDFKYVNTSLFSSALSI